MSDNDMNNMTSEELFALAKQKKSDERKWIEEENKGKIAEAREERKQIMLRQKKEISEINKKITALGGKVAGATATGKGRTGVSAAIMGLLEDVEHMDTTAIREKLESLGVSIGNLGQSLAYLKKKGKVASVARRICSIPPEQPDAVCEDGNSLSYADSRRRVEPCGPVCGL